ncbi:MAG: TlpA disulfide reductase family protein [Candidatus Sericytochromatia bacterium]
MEENKEKINYISFIKKNFSNIITILLVIFIIYTGKYKNIIELGKSFIGVGTGVPAKEFAIKDLKTNKEITLSSLKGKLVLVNFWATWCPPCRMEIPTFIELKNEYGSKGFEIVGLATESPEKLLAFMNENKINYPIGITNAKTYKDYDDIQSIPTSFLIDKNGVIIKKYMGIQFKTFLEKDIKNNL